MKLPDIETKFAILMDQFKVGSIGGNQERSMRAGRQRNQNVKVQVAEFLRSKAFVRANPREQLARLQPCLFSGCEDRVILAKHSDELALCGLGSSTP